MIMVVSDYDGTLFNGKQNLIDNIDSISKFRNMSNLFVIATERNFPSIKREIDFYNIPYDYLICNNGSVVFDNKNNLLNAEFIDEKIVKEILEYLFNNDLKDFVLCDVFGKTYSTKNVTMITFYVNSCSKLKEIRNFIYDCYLDIQVDKFYNQICIRKKCFKDFGIDCIYNSLKNKPEHIYTIGNDKTDTEMLKRFNGYLIFNAHLHDGSLRKCNSVKQLIKKVI